MSIYKTILVMSSIILLSFSVSSAQKKWSLFTQKAQTLCSQSAIKDEDILLKDSYQYTHIILINPEYVSHKVLSWIEQGGYLLIAWEYQGLHNSSMLMDYLDLDIIPFQKNSFELEILDQKYKVKPKFNDEIEGVWWHPQHQLSFTLAPWLSYQPVAFKEGSTWFTKNIQPIAITYAGLSFAYRVKIGKGIFTFMGDSDAFSDQMLIIPQNEDMSEHITEWFVKTHKRKTKKSTCSLLVIYNHSLRSDYIDAPFVMNKMKEYTQKAFKYIQSIGQQEGSIFMIIRIVKFFVLFFFLNAIYHHRTTLIKVYKKLAQFK